MAELSLTVLADYVCPYCYLAESAVARLRAEGLDVRTAPFELRPAGVPLPAPTAAWLQEAWRMKVAPLAEELGVSRRVRFLDPRPPEELVTIYQAADLVAVPSYNESFGLVAMEAQACGTPVVAARVGGLPVAVAEGETGLLVDGHDTNDWADAIEQLLDDDDTRLRMAGEAVAHAANFSWSASASQLASVYSEALSIDVDECPPRRERADGQR